MRPAGGNHRTLRRYAEEVWRIPVSHFDPRAAQRSSPRGDAIPLEAVLVEGSTYSRRSLKRRLYAAGLKTQRCELCGQDGTWRGREMSLILDHVNGVATDNRLENLRIVCPNCAATLETHCGRNLRRMRPCAVCGRPFHPGSRLQRHCSRTCGGRSESATAAQVAARRIGRPPRAELAAELAAASFEAVGRRYKVSGNAVRKWLRAYERDAG
jgi:hypothetical protein